MTWITDDSGTRWVDVPTKKRRKSPRALKFKGLKVGDQIMLKPKPGWYRGIAQYYIVTDMWFDPVDGQDDPIAGQCVAIASIGPQGETRSKSKIKIRGLASQGYDYADVDFIAQRKAAAAALETGDIVRIGEGRKIRSRPKIPGL